MTRHLLFLSVFSLVLGYCYYAQADQAVVQDFQQEYVTKNVKAKNVRGVEIRLTKTILRKDCNRRGMSMEYARFSGSGDGWYDKYIMDATIRSTLMFCPIEKPVRETISSQPVFIKSFTNENVQGEVIVTVVIPKGYNLEAKSVQ
jgi:serine protease inhibitor ecotin